MKTNNVKFVVCLLILTLFCIWIFNIEIIKAFYFWGMIASIAAVFKLLEEKKSTDVGNDIKIKKLQLEKNKLEYENKRFMMNPGNYFKVFNSYLPFSTPDKGMSEYLDKQYRISEIEIEIRANDTLSLE
jgi:hypothetical protein